MRRIFIGPLSELFNENHGRVIEPDSGIGRPVDLYYINDNNGIHISAGIDIALPGIPKENVKVSVEGTKIIISTKHVEIPKSIEYIEGRVEIPKSDLNISYDIPNESFDLNKLSANMENGILTILVPYVEKPKARSIKIG